MSKPTALEAVQECDSHLSALLGLKRAAIKRGELARVAELESNIDKWLLTRHDLMRTYQQAA